MDFNIYQVIIPLLFLAAVFGLGYYQKRKKETKKGLRLVVSNSEVKSRDGAEQKPFERHLEAVKSSGKHKS